MKRQSTKIRRFNLQAQLSLSNPNFFVYERSVTDSFCGCNRCGQYIWVDLRRPKYRGIRPRLSSPQQVGI